MMCEYPIRGVSYRERRCHWCLALIPQNAVYLSYPPPAWRPYAERPAACTRCDDLLSEAAGQLRYSHAGPQRWRITPAELADWCRDILDGHAPIPDRVDGWLQGEAALHLDRCAERGVSE